MGISWVGRITVASGWCGSHPINGCDKGPDGASGPLFLCVGNQLSEWLVTKSQVHSLHTWT